MFNTEFISQLKQSNISADGEKTKAHVQEVWKAAKADAKKATIKLAGVSINTVYRVISTGSLSAKLAVALGQTLNVDPSYLTGETDEHGECSDTLIKDFLKKHGYGKLLADQGKPKGQSKAGTKGQSKATKTAVSTTVDIKKAPSPEPEVPAAVDNPPEEIPLPDISDGDITEIIHVLKVKASLGAQGAKDDLRKIYEILLK